MDDKVVFGENNLLKEFEYEYLSNVLEEAFYRQQALLEELIQHVKEERLIKNVSKKDT